MKKLICIVLILSLIAGMLASCNLRKDDDSDPVSSNRGDNADGALDNLDEPPLDTESEQTDETSSPTQAVETPTEEKTESTAPSGETPSTAAETEKKPDESSGDAETSKQEEDSEAEETVAPIDTENPTDRVDTTPDVTEADYVKEFVNSYDNISGAYKNGDKWYLTYSLRLPEINVSEQIDEAVNAEIYSKFYIEARDLITQRCAAFDIDYEVYINGSVISVLIVKLENNEYTFYTVNIDTAKKDILTLEELAEHCGIDRNSIFEGLEAPVEDVFYLNDVGELILFDARKGDTEGGKPTLYNRSDNADLETSEATKNMFSEVREWPVEIDFDIPNANELVQEAYILGLGAGYSVARGSERIIQISNDDPSYIQVLFETAEEGVLVAVSYHQNDKGEWELVPINAITVYNPTGWDQ